MGEASSRNACIRVARVRDFSFLMQFYISIIFKNVFELLFSQQKQQGYFSCKGQMELKRARTA